MWSHSHHQAKGENPKSQSASVSQNIQTATTAKYLKKNERRKPCSLIDNSRLLTKAFTPTLSLCVANKSSISQASEECKLDHIFEVLGLLVGEGLYKILRAVTFYSSHAFDLSSVKVIYNWFVRAPESSSIHHSGKEAWGRKHLADTLPWLQDPPHGLSKYHHKDSSSCDVPCGGGWQATARVKLGGNIRVLPPSLPGIFPLPAQSIKWKETTMLEGRSPARHVYSRIHWKV